MKIWQAAPGITIRCRRWALVTGNVAHRSLVKFDVAFATIIFHIPSPEIIEIYVSEVSRLLRPEPYSGMAPESSISG